MNEIRGRWAVAQGVPLPGVPVPLRPPRGLPRLVRLDLPNGAQVCCFRCFLPIGVSGDGSRWIHAYSASEFCNGTGSFGPCGCPPVRASPYMNPIVEKFLGMA